ncbi:MAG: hypothetical protein ABL955_06455, partial [Elusimicrobiota bacterium]
GDVVKNGLDGISPKLGNNSLQVKGAAKGQLSAAKASRINARSAKGLVGSHTISGQRAFVQLAAGRGRAAISVSPNCSAGSGCPGEFAATNTGAVYDGNTISGERTDILTAPEVDGISSPNLPSTAMADDYVKEAEQMNADAEKCRALDEQYGPQELAFDKQQEEQSKAFNSMGCGQGGCSKSKANACKAMGNQMKATCRAAMTVRCEHIHACPLTAKNECSPSDCDGEARNKSRVVLVNDGQRTRTVDQGDEVDTTPMDERPECTSAKSNLALQREATQNAINDYRGNNCETLYGSTLLTDKLKYTGKCSGRENQVVNNCENYAQSLCTTMQTCFGDKCTGSSDKCVITDLKGIEDFISH